MVALTGHNVEIGCMTCHAKSRFRLVGICFQQLRYLGIGCIRRKNNAKMGLPPIATFQVKGSEERDMPVDYVGPR